MKIIRFRGKIVTTDSWVYGHYAIVDGYNVIYEDGRPFIIKLNTLSQFTGVLDKNSADIYENDKVKIVYYDHGGERCEEIVEVGYDMRTGSYYPWNWQYECDGCDLSMSIEEVEIIK